MKTWMDGMLHCTLGNIYDLGMPKSIHSVAHFQTTPALHLCRGAKSETLKLIIFFLLFNPKSSFYTHTQSTHNVSK